MVDRMFKSIMYGVISVFILYFLGGLLPKIINLLDNGDNVKIFLIAIYWIAVLSILVIPQYITWFTEMDISLIAPIKSIGAFAVSFVAIAIVTIFLNKFLAVITFESTAPELIIFVCFWLFAVLVLYVPQVFIYEPVKEMLT